MISFMKKMGWRMWVFSCFRIQSGAVFVYLLRWVEQIEHVTHAFLLPRDFGAWIPLQQKYHSDIWYFYPIKSKCGGMRI